jgi:hypothetical protein
MKAKRAWRKSIRNMQKSYAYSNKRAEGAELRSSRQYRQPLRSFINAPQQHGLSSLSPLLSPRKYLCGKINEKARAHRPQSVVGSRTGAACHRSGAFFFWGIGSAFRQPVASLQQRLAQHSFQPDLAPAQMPPQSPRCRALFHAPARSRSFSGV